MNNDVLGVILSGQLLLVVWQIYKEIRDRHAAKLRAESEARRSTVALEEMVFKLYRDRMEHKILEMHTKVDNDDPDLREALILLQDDMEFYINQGGNGLIKELYLRLMNYVREQKGDSYYILMVFDSLTGPNRT